MSDWIEVGKLSDIPRQGSRIINSDDGDIALFRTIDDEVFALRDECPHEKGPLSQGIIHGKRVTCPLHNWVISLEDGCALPPDEGCATHFPVKLEGESLFLKY